MPTGMTEIANSINSTFDGREILAFPDAFEQTDALLAINVPVVSVAGTSKTGSSERSVPTTPRPVPIPFTYNRTRTDVESYSVDRCAVRNHYAAGARASGVVSEMSVSMKNIKFIKASSATSESDDVQSPS